MNVLSLFDGQSCGQIALKELGIIPDKYYASEVDKHAIAQTQLNFPNTIQLGSVVDVDVTKLEPIDLLIGGSPCQSFSFAGKRNGMSTTENEEIYTLDRYLQLKEEGFQFEGQSYLFWEYMRILTDIRKYNPNVKFLLENVEMGNKWERVLSEAIGVFGVHINSALVSAQNRKRIYWTNFRVKEVGLFNELHSDIPQPKDEGILLKDILEKEVDEKYYLSEKAISYHESNSKKMKEQGNGFNFSPTDGNKKAVCVTTKCGSRMDDDFICVAMRGRNPDNPSDMTSGSPTEQRLEPNLNGKTNTITTVQKDNLIFKMNSNSNDITLTDQYLQINGGFDSDKRFYYENGKHGTCLSKGISKTGVVLQIKEATSKGYTEIKPGECFDFENPKSNTRRGRKMDVKCNSLMAQNMSFMNYTNDYRIRRLTTTECARLQTIPDWYQWIVSETQQYKLLGNGWTIKVIMHILKYLKN